MPFELRQPVGVDAATELLDAMDAPDAELLVIGIRHRSPVGKLLLGSVSQQLLLECPKPVLAVKPEGPTNSALNCGNYARNGACSGGEDRVFVPITPPERSDNTLTTRWGHGGWRGSGPVPDSTQRTACSYCGVGCGIEVTTRVDDGRTVIARRQRRQAAPHQFRPAVHQGRDACRDDGRRRRPADVRFAAAHPCR